MLDLFSLTEIQYLQIKPSEKGTDTNTIMMLKMFFCTNLSRDQSIFDWLKKIIICLFISCYSFRFNKFLQSEIKQKLSSFKKLLALLQLLIKINKCVLCFGGLCFSPQSVVQIKLFLQFGLIFSCNRKLRWVHAFYVIMMYCVRKFLCDTQASVKQKHQVIFVKTI